MSRTERGPRCAEHRDAAAGWRCDQCRKYLCGECTAGLLNMYFCTHCDAAVELLSIPRDEKPLRTWVIDAAMYPVKTALPSALIIAPVLLLSAIRDEIFGHRAAQAFVLAIAGVLTITYAARRDTQGGAKAVGKAAAATALIWVPVAAYLLLGKRALDDELGILIAALAAVYVPGVVTMSATDAPFARSLNPFAVFDSLWAVKRRYAAFVFWTLAFGALAVKLSVTSPQLTAEPAVNAGLATGLAILCMLIACRLLGTFAYVHGYAFGWGPRGTYVDPLIDAKPTAGRKGNYGVGQDGVASTQARTDADVALAEARDIRRLLAKDKVEEALALYEKRNEWDSAAFNAKALLDLGVAAAKAKQLELAVDLLTRVSDSGSPFVPRALFRLARLHETALDTADRALALYERLVAEHPNSDVARPAKDRLVELRGRQ